MRVSLKLKVKNLKSVIYCHFFEIKLYKKNRKLVKTLTTILRY